MIGVEAEDTKAMEIANATLSWSVSMTSSICSSTWSRGRS